MKIKKTISVNYFSYYYTKLKYEYIKLYLVKCLVFLYVLFNSDIKIFNRIWVYLSNCPSSYFTFWRSKDG